MWTCHCGLTNKLPNLRCDDCGMPYLLSTPKQPDLNNSNWQCYCGTLNKDIECINCGMPKGLASKN